MTFSRFLRYARFGLQEALMKRFMIVMAACLAFAGAGTAQQAAADAPATKEDIQKYLEVMHSRDMMAKMVEAMSKPMHQMMHEEYLKDKDKLPPDFEARMNKIMDDYMKDSPFDEMLQAMVPAYQKHLTKGDVDNLVTFYASPTGQKLIRELPAISAEAMQAVLPLIRQRMDAVSQRVQEQMAQMVKESKNKPADKTPATPN
jgi:uncharacterized protein